VLTQAVAKLTGWSLAAAAMIAVATVGYHGGMLAAPAAAQPDIATELSFGLTSDGIDSEADPLWQAFEEVSP
jgi:hypothetical protein